MNNLRYRHYLLSCLIGLLLPTGVTHAEQGDWLVRLRGIAVAPNDDSSRVSLNGAPLAGTGVAVDTQAVPEIDVTYMFHRNWGIELIAATAEHNVGLQGNIGPVSAGTKLFDTWVLPPTLTLQYHFLPDNKFSPYIGAGVNYTTFLGENASGTLENQLGPVDVKMDNSWGWALQAGMDIDIKDNWFINFDIKYIDIDSTATLDFGSGNRLSVGVDIDPWVAGAGIGYRF